MKPTYKDHWQLPGGVAEADEAPLAAAERSVRRELGLPVSLDRLLVVDWVAPRDGIAIEGLLFVYDAPPLTAEQIDAISLPMDELEQWAWCDDRQLRERLPVHITAASPPRDTREPTARHDIWRMDRSAADCPCRANQRHDNIIGLPRSPPRQCLPSYGLPAHDGSC